MIGTCLLLPLTLLLASGDTDAPTLIARLGSTDPAERAAAIRGLEALGRPALAPLVAACHSADVAVRDRALDAWKAVQRGVLLRPTIIPATTPLTAEVLIRLAAEQGGMAVEAENQTALSQMLPEPLPFWTAVDRLGLAGPSLQQREIGGGHLPVLLFQPIPTRYPTSTRGLFHFTLQGLHERRDTTLIAGPWSRVDSSRQRFGIARDAPREDFQLYADLFLMIEPRMWFTQVGPARAMEVVDDLGQSLVRPADATAKTDYSSNGTSGGVVGGYIQLDLAVPPRAGRRIVRLRGQVPLVLQARYPVPDLDLKWDDAIGHTFTTSLGSFTVDRPGPAELNSAALTVKLDPAGNDCPTAGESPTLSARVNCLFTHQVEFVAADGIVLSGSGGSSWWPSGSGEMYENFGVGPTGGRPDRLRIYRMLRVFTEVEFEFADIPLP